MLIYRFKAYDSKGKIHTGNLFMPSEEEAISFLLRNNLTPLEVKLIPQTLISQFLFKLFFKITFDQKLFLLRNLALLLKSGMNLDKGLALLTEEAKGGLKDFLFYLNYNLQRGEPLYKTFSFFPSAFNEVEVETIRAGELSGNLVENLENLVKNLERQKQIKNEIISSIIYPAIVLFLAFGVLVLLITFVMPKISLLLAQLTDKPPFFTQILLSVSNFVNQHLNLVIIFLFLSFSTLIFFFLFRKTRNLMIKLLMKAPLFSKIYLSLAFSQSLFILRSLLGAGIPLTQALKLTAEATFHPEIKKAFQDIEKGLRTGKKFGDALKEEPAIPSFLASVLAIASESGTLEETLKVMEEFYLDEFRNMIRNFLNLLQPALIIFVGLIVAFVALAVLIPLYQQISNQLQMQQGRGQMPGF